MNIASYRDITQTHNLLNEMGKMAKIGAWELDVETMKQLWTDETYEIHDVDKKTYDPNVSKEINSFIPQSKTLIENAVGNAIKYGKPYDLELEMITAKGNHKTVRAIGNIYKVGDKVKKVYGSVQDITEQKKVEQRLQEIDRAKTEFVSLASHQLRTPLTTISWYTEMILRGDVGQVQAEQKKYLEEIYQGNKRMVDLVNTLLDVSRIELGTFVSETSPTDIAAILQSVLDELDPQIGAKKLSIEKKWAKNLPSVISDPKLLRMIFQNILANAVEYTPAGGSVAAEISLEEKGGDKKALIVKVSDTGYGIPKGQQEKIFTKLFRADNVRKRDTDGTGLGLYIVKSVIEQMKGKVWFESEEDRGTTFFMSFPLGENYK